MYAKSEVLSKGNPSKKSPKGSLITWNSIEITFAQHGQGYIALDLFLANEEENVKLDYIVCVPILTVCSRIGLVEEGCRILTCVVNMCQRFWRLDEAKALVESKPFEPDAMVWKTLLGACRVCEYTELDSQVGSHAPHLCSPL